jgi:hypothetical protein
LEWDWVKVIVKDDADVILVLEPREIDNVLDYGMSIWITWALPRVEILGTIWRYGGAQLAENAMQ